MWAAITWMLVTIGGAALMLAGGVVLLMLPRFPIGPDGFAFVGYSDGLGAFPAIPVATVLLIAGFVAALTGAIGAAVVARRRG
ncbi:hypothetical protein [Pseudolysinimonas sp.]|uniref:hypothetical protein n=1 Tax=Pseudolysinimonas sp. TaxID=2680009 RepID=UPI003F7FB3C3